MSSEVTVQIGRRFEIRDPIHGFISLSEWERDIINHWVFQRLRRIRQLGWTDMVYPGATHTRFEHSLGVMHIATRMYKRIVSQRRSREILENHLNYNYNGLNADKKKVRLSCLLHDVGHAPFSHASEALFPINDISNEPFTHEDYSAAAIKLLMSDVIDKHPHNENYGISSADIANLIKGSHNAGRTLLWRELLSSQLDADRADYLLRDAHHIGVEYGRYDLNRLLVTMTLALGQESETPSLAVELGGYHAAEGLILARYMMFTQVYFQHTRRAFDFHIESAIKKMLIEEQEYSDLKQKDCFPPPTSEQNIKKYFEWTDWKVLGLLSQGAGGDHGEILRTRNHYRPVYETDEVPTAADLERFFTVKDALNDYDIYVDETQKSWYKFSNSQEIMVLDNSSRNAEVLRPLSNMSNVVKGLGTVQQHRIYVSKGVKPKAVEIVKKVTKRTAGGSA